MAHNPAEFPRYQYFLHQGEVWPSSSNEDHVPIKDMVPRYAASAHAKLLRWAGTIQAQTALNLHDVQERIRFVRASRLAQALTAQVHGVRLEEPAEHKASPEDAVLISVCNEIALHYPNWSFEQVYMLGKHIVKRIQRDHELL